MITDDQQAWFASVTLRHCRRGHGATQWWPGASPWASPRRSCRTPAGARRARLHARISFYFSMAWSVIRLATLIMQRVATNPPCIAMEPGTRDRARNGLLREARTGRASPVAHGGASAANSPELRRPASLCEQKEKPAGDRRARWSSESLGLCWWRCCCKYEVHRPD